MDLAALSIKAIDGRVSDEEIVRAFTEFCASIKGKTGSGVLIINALEIIGQYRKRVFNTMRNVSLTQTMELSRN